MLPAADMVQESIPEGVELGYGMSTVLALDFYRAARLTNPQFGEPQFATKSPRSGENGSRRHWRLVR